MTETRLHFCHFPAVFIPILHSSISFLFLLPHYKGSVCKDSCVSESPLSSYHPPSIPSLLASLHSLFPSQVLCIQESGSKCSLLTWDCTVCKFICSSPPFLDPWGASVWDLGVFCYARAASRTGAAVRDWGQTRVPTDCGLNKPIICPFSWNRTFETSNPKSDKVWHPRPIWDQIMWEGCQIWDRPSQTSDLSRSDASSDSVKSNV